MGHGHPRRDAIEWLIPPLWPWKLVSLPARGPRPTLKGETEVTLRLMDDVEVPLAAAASRPAAAQSVPRATPSRPPAEWSAMTAIGSRPAIRYLLPSITGMPGEATSDAPTPWSADSAAESVPATPPRDTLIALKGEAIYAATDYWIEGVNSFACCGAAVKAHSISTTWTGKGPHALTPSAESPSISGPAHASTSELATTGADGNPPQLDFWDATEAHVDNPGRLCDITWRRSLAPPLPFLQETKHESQDSDVLILG